MTGGGVESTDAGDEPPSRVAQDSRAAGRGATDGSRIQPRSAVTITTMPGTTSHQRSKIRP
jgi:hypothetical protein